MKYRPEIDGLRALAVMPVIFYHAGIDWFSGGFVGVDVFFVISGYLITTIIIDEIEGGKFSIAGFYERRARRILPALTVMTIAVFIAAWLLMNPLELRKFGDAAIGVATFASNIIFWRTQGYFDEASELNPLIHTWSLSVEEQFYVIFPVVLLLAWRFGRSRMFVLLLIAAVGSLALSEWGWRHYASANFFLLPTRGWELLAGALAALVLQRREVRPGNLLSMLGLAAIVISVFLYDESVPFPSLYALLPVLGVVLVILFAGSGTLTARILGNRLFVGVGLISYSAYLWHQPVFAFYRLQSGSLDMPVQVIALLVPASVCLGYLSWRFVETPFRIRGFLSRNRIFLISFLSLLLIAAGGFLSKRVSDGYERELARVLSGNEFIYFRNMDERKFVEARLALPLRPVDTLVMGSSRYMQVGSRTLDRPIMNLSVSGASVEDYVALVAEAAIILEPQEVILGADPWLFNRFDGQERWQSIRSLYDHWVGRIGLEQDASPETSHLTFSDVQLHGRGNAARDLFSWINQGGKVVADDGDAGAIAKKAYDGFHVNTEDAFANTEAQKRAGFDSVLVYAMSQYEFDPAQKERYVSLVQWLRARGVTVTIALSPYHPDLHERMVGGKTVFSQIEQVFRDIANETGARIAGSYDPGRSGCSADEFFDGMHPKESCMRKVLQ